MSAHATVFRKDMRLAATVVVPALGVLAMALTIMLFGHLIPVVGRALWGSSRVPAVAERLATFQPFAAGALYIAAVWTAVIVAQGDRVRRAAALAVVLPLSDADKILSKIACLAVLAVTFAAFIALNALSSGKMPRDWSGTLVLVGAAPALGVLCGLAAASLVRNVTAAVLVGLALPLLGLKLGWFAASAFARVGVSDPSVARELPEYMITSAWESAFEAATVVAGATWVLLVALLGARVLAGRAPTWNIWLRLGVPLAGAMIAAAVTAAVVVERDGSIASIYKAISAREAVRAEAQSLDTVSLLLWAYGIERQDAHAVKRTCRTVVLFQLGMGVHWSGFLRGKSLTHVSERELWPGERDLQTRFVHQEIIRRLRPDPADGSFELRRAVREIVVDSRISVWDRIQLLRSGVATPVVPELAALLLSTQDEFEQAYAITAIAACAKAGKGNDVLFADFETVGHGLDWCGVLETASEVLRATMPHEFGEIPGAAGQFPAFPADEALIRAALDRLKEPLPEVASAVVELQRERERIGDAAVFGERNWKLAPGTLDCLRKGL